MWHTFLLLLLIPFTVFANPSPAHEIFQLSESIHDPNTIVAKWQIKPGYFLYKDRIKIEMATNDVAQLGTIQLPAGELKQDPKKEKEYEVFRQQLNLSVPLLALKAGNTILHIHYQGCSDTGFCYPPMTKSLQVTLDPLQGIKHIENISETVISTPNPNVQFGTLQYTEQLLLNSSLLMIVASFFILGLLLSFTPCVLPMIPIISGIIIRHQTPVTSKKAFLLSFVYVLSMASTYAILGILVAYLGNNIQVSLQQPWVLILFSSFFILLALSMFGWFELKLPDWLEARIHHFSHHPAGGTYLRTAIMGCLATLIVSPCITPPLAGALTYIAEHGNPALGGLALFSLGFGMGMPLLLIATSGAKLLPKAGHWMEAVKIFFGILLLAVAISLLQRIVSGSLALLLWAALLILTSLYLGAFRFIKTNHPLRHFRQGLGLISFLYGTLLIIGAGMGNTNPLQPLAGINQTHKTQYVSSDSINTVTTLNEVQILLAQAKQQQKPAILDFYADWCISCKSIEQKMANDPEIQTLLANFVFIKADITAVNAETKELLNYFKVIAPPTFVFYGIDGKEISSARRVGEIEMGDLLQQLKQIYA